MKKKFSLWFNIVTICLCICAIAVGVYSATNASLTVSGTVGFTAHGVDMTITGTLSGYVLDAEKDTSTRTRDLNEVELGGENNIKTAAMSFADKTNTESGTAVYFTDLIGTTIPEIELTLTFTNTSSFKVIGTINIPDLTSSNIEVTEKDNKESITLGADKAADCSDSITLIFSVINANNPVNIDLSTIEGLNISFEKYNVYSVTIKTICSGLGSPSDLKFGDVYYVKNGESPVKITYNTEYLLTEVQTLKFTVGIRTCPDDGAYEISSEPDIYYKDFVLTSGESAESDEIKITCDVEITFACYII